MTKNPRVGIYLRVSSADQTHASQEHAIRGYCRRRGWKIAAVFKDTASGANAARTELDRLMQSARAGELDVIAVFKIDRLGRSIAHLTQTVAELQRLKINLVSTSEGIETAGGDPATRLTLNLLGSMAHFERDQLIDRIKAGHKAAKRRGVKIGRPEMKQETIDQIVSLRTNWKKGMTGGPLSFETIGERVGVNASTAFRIFKKYGGKEKTP